MSFYGHNELRNRQSIIQDLQQQKQYLLQGSYSSANMAASSQGQARASRQHIEIPSTRRSAIDYANAHSSGFFIPQESAFGNPILPVIPRAEE